jgi:hypothetical protein
MDGNPRIQWKAEGVIPYCTCLADARIAAEDKMGLVASTFEHTVSSANVA